MKDNTISVYNLQRQNWNYIVSQDDWFKGGRDIIVHVEWDKVVFKYPTLDYKGKTYKITKYKNGIKRIYVTQPLPSMKEVEFDEDSTDDCKVVYY
jgi:hypothetical protein